MYTTSLCICQESLFDFIKKIIDAATMHTAELIRIYEL